jgi:hypothetical protein
VGRRGSLSYGANIVGNFPPTFSEGTGIEKREKLVLITLRRAASLKKRIERAWLFLNWCKMVISLLLPIQAQISPFGKTIQSFLDCEMPESAKVTRKTGFSIRKSSLSMITFRIRVI